VAVFSRGIWRIPHLEQFLGAKKLLFRPSARLSEQIDYVVGWGHKGPAQRAHAFARRCGLPFVRLEDGFLRSVAPGFSGEPPLSLICDARGVYYDARTPSRLEALLSGDEPDSPRLEDTALIARAERCIERIVQGRLSKYNHTPLQPSDALPAPGEPTVLVVDQTVGDMSVTQGLVPADGFARMLETALAEHPHAEVIVKTHPDVIAGKKRGYLTNHAHHPRVRLLAELVNPVELVSRVRHVYVATSQLGFEALLAGTPVSCFGVPFYAGWGATDDRAPVPRRDQKRSVAQIFAAAYLLYARYVHPDSEQPSEIESIIEHLERQRYWFRQNQGTFYGLGFSRWKERNVRSYLRAPGNRVVFLRRASALNELDLPRDARLLVWGLRDDPRLRASARRKALPIWRMEDGFLRSVGLGSDITAPASLVLDTSGVYYDPSCPSDLERLLQESAFDEQELARAAKLRESIVASRVSKYNTATDRALEPSSKRRPIILAVGQVDTDASIRLGCPDIPTNEAFLARIRQRHPEAHIIYKPHPDVVSLNRRGRVRGSHATQYCDQIVTDLSVARCLEAVDQVHVRTSLVGFEALLRGLRVVVYGQPFYCGWGLTDDLHPPGRRSRQLSLDQLVAGVLLRYPRYLNTETGTFTTAEMTVARLRSQRDLLARRGATPIHLWPVRQLRRLIRVWVGV
jgi:capsular polysaccharide export protein